MYALVFLGLLSCAIAAPRYGLPPPHHRHHHHHHGDFSMDRFYDDHVFDTRQFWDQLSKEMTKFDQMMDEFMTQFPRSTSSAVFKDNQYIITIALNGFSEKDIVVKAREGLVMVQAVRTNEAGTTSYMDARNLPEGVSPAGQWTYEGGLLKIVLPVTKERTTEVAPTDKLTTEAEAATDVTDVVTEVVTVPPKDREEMESHEGEENIDADVGLERGDNELLTNEVPRHNTDAIEATTYAIDVRDNIDFVPISIRQ